MIFTNGSTFIREATCADIPPMHQVRVAVKENVLSDPARISYKDYEEYFMRRGKGWVAEVNGIIVGFAIADLHDHNIWALFIQPGHEKKGIGRQLHDRMMSWYFEQTKCTVWLSTSPGTRAEQFYRNAGWTEAGRLANGEIRFEMMVAQWQLKQQLQG